MAQIIRRKSDNYAVFLIPDSETVTLTESDCSWTKGDHNVQVLDINSTTHDLFTDVAEPTSFFGNCMTYIDGTWAIDTDKVAKINEGMSFNELPDITVEI
tara:strand:+ start:729 stop:1028 length:300 start_codon:yes stop_codon:yes gene_type:complete